MPSNAQISDVFHTTVTDLQNQAASQVQAAQGQGPRPWQVPATVTDVLDIEGIVAGFDRTDPNQNFEEVISGGASGTIGDVVSLKVQVDYVGVVERGFRARHATTVRCAALAFGRRNGHGMPNGIFGGGVLKYAQDALKSGAS